jgi:hypothetical protein
LLVVGTAPAREKVEKKKKDEQRKSQEGLVVTRLVCIFRLFREFGTWELWRLWAHGSKRGVALLETRSE